MELKTTKDKREKDIMSERVTILKEYITDKLKGSRVTKISKVAESVKNNVENVGKIWEVKTKYKITEQNSQ